MDTIDFSSNFLGHARDRRLVKKATGARGSKQRVISNFLLGSNKANISRFVPVLSPASYEGNINTFHMSIQSNQVTWKSQLCVAISSTA